MAKVARKSAEKTIGVKYPIEINARIQKVAEALGQRSFVPVPLTYVMCQIAQRGLDAYEQELGITKSSAA